MAYACLFYEYQKIFNQAHAYLGGLKIQSQSWLQYAKTGNNLRKKCVHFSFAAPHKMQWKCWFFL